MFTGQWSSSPHEREALQLTLEARGGQLGAFSTRGASGSLWDLRQSAARAALPQPG
jgi:hypothetical protein